MKSLSKILFLTGFFLLLGSQKATATEYYVSVNTGSDSNDGSISSPWQTTAHAFTFVGPGDVVNLFEGKYPAIPNIPGGTLGNPVTVRGIPGERVRISDQSVNNGILILNDHVVVENLEIDNMPSNGVNIQANYITVRNCIIRHTGIGVKSNISTKNHHILIERCSFWWYTDIIIFPDEVEKFVVRNCLFQEAASVVMDPGGAVDLLIENNLVDQDNRSLGPLKLRWGNVELVDEPNNNGAIVRNNIFLEGSKYGLLLASANGAMVYNNTMMNNLVIGSLERGILYAQLDPSASPGNPNGPNERNVIKNNIFQLNGGDNAQGSLNQVLFEARTDMVDDLPTWTIDNNLYYKSGGVEYIQNGLSTITESNVGGWGSGFDLNSVVGQDPLLPTLDPVESPDEYIPPSNSPAIDAGAALTVTVGPGTSNIVTVEDSRYFFGGYGMVPGDEIKIGGNTVTVTDRDIDNNTITIDQVISWSAGEEVTFPYTGSAPDIGVYENGTPRAVADAFGAQQFYAFTKGITPANTPSGLTASVTGTNSIDLSWSDNSSTEDGFVIQRSLTGYDGWTDIDNVSAGSQSYTDNTVNCGTTYYYRVRAFNAAGNSFASNKTNATTSGCSPTPPIAPSNLAATSPTYSSVNLTWTDNADNEANFEIERSPNGSTGWTVIDTNGVNDTTFTDSGLNCETTYYYRVRATNIFGNSSYSNTANVTTLTCPTIPNPPSGLAGTAISATSISLTWTDNSNNEETFLIERSPNGSSGWTEIGTNPADDNTFIDNGLTCETTYYYRVRAANIAGNSAYSNTANATTTVCPPNTPSDLTATATGLSTIELSWTDNSNDEDNFEIERSLSGSSGWTQVGINSANENSFTDTTVSCGTTYYYRVRATNSLANSEYSNVANTATPACPTIPNPPSSLTVTFVSENSIDITWADNSDDEDNFLIERSADGISGWIQVGNNSANDNTFTDGGVACETNYYYRVRASNTAGNSAYSNTANTTTSTCGAGSAWTELTYDDFEGPTGSGSFGNYTDGSSTNNNYCRLYNNPANVHQGTYAVNIERGDPELSRFYLTDGIDVTGYTQIKVEFWFKAIINNGSPPEGLVVEYFDGMSWVIAAHYVVDRDFVNNTFYNGTVLIDRANYTFPTDMKIQFRSACSSSNDDIYVDEVRISALTSPSYTLEVNILGSGSVTLNPTGGTYVEGTIATLTATPISGFVFNGWSGDLSGTANPAQIVMDGDKTVTANFILEPIESEELPVVSATASSQQNKHRGPEKTLDNDLGTQWAAKGDGEWICYDLGKLYTVSYLSIAWDKGTEWTYNFDIEVSKDSSANWTEVFSGQSSGITTQHEVYDFEDLEGRYVRMVGHGNNTSNQRIQIAETDIYGGPVRYTLTISSIGSGSVTPETGVYNDGDEVTLTASPAEGWQFDNWSGDLSDTTNPAVITMDGNKSITANFSEILYSLNISVIGDGSVTQDPLDSVYTLGTVVTLTAVPDAGWEFEEWSGDLSGSDNPVEITMDGNKSVTAAFIFSNNAWTELTYDDFEDGNFGNYTDGSPSNNNYCRLINNASHAHQGTYCVNIERGDPELSRFYLTDGIDVTGYAQLMVEFWFKGTVNNGSPPEALLVEYFDGTSWNIVGNFVAGVDFNHQDGSFNNPTVLIDKADYTFPTDMKIQFRSACTSSNDDFYIDEIKISGYGPLAKRAFTDKTAEVVIPDEYSISNYPNPFNPSTIIQYGLPKAGHVELTVYDITGRKVAEVFKGNKSAGTYRLSWNAKDNYGRSLASGVYFLNINTKDYRKTIKMMYLR